LFFPAFYGTRTHSEHKQPHKISDTLALSQHSYQRLSWLLGCFSSGITIGRKATVSQSLEDGPYHQSIV